MDGDDIAMFNTEVVSNDSIDTSATVVKIIIGQDDEDSISSLLALDQNGVATEEL